ncbi:MAG: hypothetical protein E7492_03685 [Ruminococcaceae bacterium]|nr:hypothetical protein [Oscillospiraceae bacterium]
MENKEDKMKQKKAIDIETFVVLFVIIGGFTALGSVMGIGNLFNTIMNTAHDLLLNTVFFIMAISVVTGAISNLMAEFGVISLLNKLISPLMRPVYGLPGAASLGILSTFVSDNPAILTLAKTDSFTKYFKPYQVPALCNLGTSFGMGMILVTYMMGLGGEGIIGAALIGVLGACIGSVVSVRLMMSKTKKYYNVSKEESKADHSHKADQGADEEYRTVHGSALERVLNAILEGGKTGVQLGLDIIPGVLCICTFVMILTFGAPADGIYTGAAYEGIGLLPKLGDFIAPVTGILFGFKDPSNIAFPITSLGATGAAMALVPRMLATGAAGLNEIAVFTAMGMCWSGYLSTHISMMDALDRRQFIKDAIVSHTIGGLCAGVAAHYIFMLVSLL